MAALLLAGCTATPQTRGLLADPPASLAPAAELETTPFWPQARYQCGPAALATVLNAQGVQVTPEQLVDAVYIPGLQGSLAVELAAATRRHGLLAYRLPASLASLLEQVDAGHPVLVLQNLGTGWAPRWHFAVVIGYDLEKRELYLRSGTTRRWRTSLAAFERTWARGDHWALVALAPGTLPASPERLEYLRAAHEFETANIPDAALPAYRTAVRRWPETAAAWLALGNNRYAAGDYTQAAPAFRRATEVSPGDARGWNNLAYALLKSGCPSGAGEAAACAVRLAPENTNYRDTLAEVTAVRNGRDAAECLPVDCRAGD